MPNLPQPGSIRTSASMPHVARRPKPDAIAAVARRAHPLPSKHFLPKLGTPNSPHGVGQPAQKKARAEAAQPPAALRDIQNFLDGELKNLDARHGAPEVRLQAHRQAFDLFIGHFGTYAGPLSAIKHEYESYTLLLQKRIDASAKRQADAHADFNATHERIISSLQQQLKETSDRLAFATQQLADLQSNDDILGGETSQAAAANLADVADVGGKAVDEWTTSVPSCSGFGGSKWSVVAKSLDDPAAKVSRMLKAVERLCKTPELLKGASTQLLAMMSWRELGETFVSAVRLLKPEERVQVALSLTNVLDASEKCDLFDRGLSTLRPNEKLCVLEPQSISLHAGEREGLLAAVLETSGLPEEERVGLAKILLKSEGASAAGEGRCLAASEGLLRCLVQVWGDDGPEHVAKVLEVMDPKTRRQAGSQVLIASMVDALQLEEALERIYAHEDTEVAGNNALRAEVEERRQQSFVARHELERGKMPRIVCTSSRLLHLDPNDDPLHDHRGGLKLLCDCSRMWIVRSTLLAEVRGQEEAAGVKAHALSIRRFEDTRYASKEEREARERERMKALLPSRAAMHRKRSVRRMSIQAKSKMVIEDEDEAQYQTTWHLPRETLLGIVADVWTELCTDLSNEGHRNYGKLDVGACFWRFFLARHGLKSLAQRALYDFNVSLKAEAGRFDCPARLRMAAEMLGLGPDLEDQPWLEPACHFLLWLLPYCLPLQRMRSHLVKPNVMVPLMLVQQLVRVAVPDVDTREPILLELDKVAFLEIDSSDSPSAVRSAAALKPLREQIDGLANRPPSERGRTSTRDSRSRRTSAGMLSAANPAPPEVRPPSVSTAAPRPPATQNSAVQSLDALLAEMGKTVEPDQPVSSREDALPTDATVSAPAPAAGVREAPAAKEEMDNSLETEVKARVDVQKYIELDDVLTVLMRKWNACTLAAKLFDQKKLIILTRAFDENGDGVLDYNEFVKLVTRAEVVASREELIPLYEKTLERSRQLRQETLNNERLARQESGEKADPIESQYTAGLPDAIDPIAFAEVVAHTLRKGPVEFYCPQEADDGAHGSSGIDDDDDDDDDDDEFVERSRGSGASPLEELDAAEIRSVIAGLSNNILFSSMDHEKLEQLVLCMERWEHTEGLVLINEGELGSHFYVLASGLAEATIKQGNMEVHPSDAHVVMRYDADDKSRRCFGELALIYAKPRAASIVLRSDCVVYAMSRRMFRESQKRNTSTDLLAPLRTLPVFNTAEHDHNDGAMLDVLRRLNTSFEEVSYEDNEVIVREGEPADQMHIILSGFARVHQREHPNLSSSPTKQLDGYLTDATIFGETVLCPRGTVRHTATVSAVGYCRTARFTRDAIERDLGSELLEQLNERCPALPIDVMNLGWLSQGIKRFRMPPAEFAMHSRLHQQRLARTVRGPAHE